MSWLAFVKLRWDFIMRDEYDLAWAKWAGEAIDTEYRRRGRK